MQTDATTDEELVRRIQSGDQRAWSLFLERYTDLIYRKALHYSGASDWSVFGAQDREDEVGELYLFMAQSVLRSLKSFKGACKPSTWILSVIGNRKHVLKAFLLRKDPSRAEVRLPAVLQSRSQTEQEIFRRLVWGLDVGRIAQDLGVSEDDCREVEALLASHSPRVHARIQANRRARIPKLSLDAWTEENRGRPRLQIAHPGPDPADQVELESMHEALQRGLSDALAALDLPQRRVLSLLYGDGLSAAEIVQLATADPALGLDGVRNVNRCYYLKDRALESILQHITSQLERAGHAAAPSGERRKLLKRIEDLLKQQGVAMSPRGAGE